MQRVGKSQDGLVMSKIHENNLKSDENLYGKLESLKESRHTLMERFELIKELERTNIESRYNIIYLLKNIMSRKANSSPETVEGLKELDKLLSDLELLKERNKVINDEEKDFSLEGLANLAPESLLDDFADPNLEQPSYMDPED